MLPIAIMTLPAAKILAFFLTIAEKSHFVYGGCNDGSHHVARCPIWCSQLVAENDMGESGAALFS